MLNATPIELLSSLKSALLNTVQFALHSFSGLLLTDEFHFMFGWSVLYPSIVLTLLFVATRQTPAGTVKKCKKYCLKVARLLRHFVLRNRVLLFPVRLALGLAYYYPF